MENVIKRDGRLEKFDNNKIKRAIMASMQFTPEGIDEELADKIANSVATTKKDMAVEAIQDIVEQKLMASKRKDAAKEYILYRDKRNKARGRTQANIFADIIDTKVNDVTRDNANMNADTPAGMMMKFAAESTKPYVDAYLLTDEARTAVEGNYLYIHK